MAFTDEDQREFYQQAHDLLEEAEKSLIDIGKGADFQPNYDRVFRAYHSIKGGASVFGNEALRDHLHQLESLLAKCCPAQALTEAEVDFFLRGVDATRTLVNGKPLNGFTYEIPTAAPKVAPAQVISIEIAPKTKSLGKIAVVDDEQDIVDCLRDILLAAGFEVIGFTEPRTALEAIRQNPVDAVFSDFQMPSMKGSELAVELNQIWPSIPVVIVSGYIKGNTLLHGVSAIIEKPFDEKFVVHSAMMAVERSQTARLLNRAIDLLMYQFCDLDDFLKMHGKEDVRRTLNQEIKNIVDLRNGLRTIHIKKSAI